MKVSENVGDKRYLLHLWHDRSATLGISLRDVTDGQLRTFTSLEEMMAYLEAEHTTIDSEGVGQAASGTNDEGEGT